MESSEINSHPKQGDILFLIHKNITIRIIKVNGNTADIITENGELYDMVYLDYLSEYINITKANREKIALWKALK